MLEVTSARPVRMLVGQAAVLTAVLVVAGLSSVATPTAQAGTYQARVCWPGETWPAPYLSDAYQRVGSNYGSYPYIFSDFNCGDGSEYMGVGATYSWASYGDYAYWAFDAPANTSFTRFTANRIYSAVHYYNNTGIFVRSGGAYQTLFHHYTNGTAYDGPGDWAVSGDQIISQVWCTGFGCDPTSANGIYLTSMTFRLNDPHPPTISNVQGSIFSGGWKKPGTESVSAQANDLGGGVSKVGLKVTNGSSTTETAQQPSSCTTTTSGYAAVLRPCPLQASYSRSVNTANAPFASGISTVSVCTSDYANLGSAPSEDCEAATLKLDGQPPSQSTSGTGWPTDGSAISDGEKTVAVSATDGVQGGTNAQRRSGVKEIQLRVWNADEESRPDEPTETTSQTTPGCGTTQDSCPLNATFSYDPEDYADDAGTSAIKVEVTTLDYAGNATPVGANVRTFTFTQDIDSPTVAMTTTPLAGGYYLVQLRANDPTGTEGGTVSSGVRRLELRVDGAVVQEWTQSCPNGGCSMNQQRLMGPADALSSHEVTAFAQDGAMNEGFARSGARLDRGYQEFGYNDQFFDPDQWVKGDGLLPPPNETAAARLDRGIQTAAQGGAELVRFQISGCHVALDENEWHWESPQAMFDRVAAHNSTRETDQKLRVIVHLTDAPPWAAVNRFNDPPGCGGPVSPPKDNATGEGFWRLFVRRTLERFGPQANPDYGLLAVQAWNEPNSPNYWGWNDDDPQQAGKFKPDPDHFARLVNIAVDVRNDNNYDVSVLPGALAPRVDKRYRKGQLYPYIRDVLGHSDDEGPASWNPDTSRWVDPDAIDAWAAHYYSRNQVNRTPPAGGDPNEGALSTVNRQDQQVRRALAIRKRDNGRPLPIWITELGFSANPNQALGNSGWPEQSFRLTWALSKFGKVTVGGDKFVYPAFLVHRLIDPAYDQQDEYYDQLAVIDRDREALPANGPPRQTWEARNAYCDLAAAQSVPQPELCPPDGAPD